MSITFVSVLLRFVNYLNSWIKAISLTLKCAASTTDGCLTKGVGNMIQATLCLAATCVLSPRNFIQTSLKTFMQLWEIFSFVLYINASNDIVTAWMWSLMFLSILALRPHKNCMGEWNKAFGKLPPDWVLACDGSACASLYFVYMRHYFVQEHTWPKQCWFTLLTGLFLYLDTYMYSCSSCYREPETSERATEVTILLHDPALTRYRLSLVVDINL